MRPVGVGEKADPARPQHLVQRVQERADVATQLLASLEDAAENADSAEQVEAEWAVEIERRARRVLSGESAGIPWQDVRRRAEEEIRRR